MHSKRATVCCGFCSGGVIRSYFFENESGNEVTVNGICYRNMITEFLWLQLDGMDLDDMWLQEDGTTCYITHATINLLQKRFPDQITLQNADVNWSSR